MKTLKLPFVSLAVLLGMNAISQGGDWPRYRGPNGSGVSGDEAEVPTGWSATENMKWKVPLPGPGHSSPIIVGDKVLLTYWSGYAAGGDGGSGDQKDLVYHLLCLNRKDGKVIWDTEVKPELPEERYAGMFMQHGYTTHTPASDGKNIYAFFGKTGVAAFDLDGNKLWQTSVGTNRDRRGWGSASSPILYKDFVIVLASIENSALVALDKKTGKQAWIAEADGLASLWGTPVIVDAGGGRAEIVVVTNGEIWAINPDNGKLRWYSEGPGGRSISTSALSHGNVVYVVGGQGGTTAVRAGGRNDVTSSHRLWESQRSGGTGTPVFHDGRLHWVNSGTAYALDAESGDDIYRERIDGGEIAEGAPREQPRQRPGGGGGFGRGGGGGGFGGTRDYPSPVVSGDKLFQLSGSGEVTVIKLGDELEVLGKNRFEGDGSKFVATPAISDGQMFVRSAKFLYCVGK